MWLLYFQEFEINNNVPEFDGDAGLLPPNPQVPGGGGLGEESGEESGEEDEEYGNVHIVELHKNGEPLGIQLTHYTSPEGMWVVHVI